MESTKNIKVSNLYRYPLKSGHESELFEAILTKTGIINDRILLVLTKQQHEVLTIISNPQLYEVQTSVLDENVPIINIIIPSCEGIFDKKEYLIDLSKKNQDLILTKIKVWKIETDVYQVNDKILQQHLSSFLKSDAILVFPANPREMNKYPQKSLFSDLINSDDTTYFADIAPLLITSNESLNFINEKLEAKGVKPVKMINFRPNIVLEGGNKAFWEDSLNTIKIGNVTFRRVLGCTRCKQTTYDTELKRFHRTEPLGVLDEYQFNEELEGVVFGQYFCVDPSENVDNIIKVGDGVEILN
jgi:uncharacterized protein YcbX